MSKRTGIVVFMLLAVLQLAGCGGGTDEAAFDVEPDDSDGSLLQAAPVLDPEVRYGDVVYLKSNTWQNYLSGRSDSGVRMLMTPRTWEEWVILDPACVCPTKKPVLFNDTVLFRSVTWGQFLSARSSVDGAEVKMMPTPSALEEFKIIDPDQPASTAAVKWNDRSRILSVNWKNYLSGRTRDETLRVSVQMMAQAKELEQWHIAPKGSTRNSFWMGELGATLQNVALTQAAIPGSHDAGTYSIADDAPFSPDLPLDDPLKNLLLASAKLSPKVNYYMARFARAQTTDIIQQLNAGIRYFDMRPGGSNNGQGTDLLVVHSLYGGDILPMVTAVGDFLKAHPKEVVILDFSHFTAMNDAHHQKLIAHIKDTFGSKLAPRPVNATKTDPQANTYTFETMWKNGWQVVGLYNDSHADAESQLWRYGTPQETLWWPNKPTTDKVKAHLDNVLANNRPLLAAGSFFVLQTILTGDEALYAKAIVKLEAPLEELQSKLKEIQGNIATLGKVVKDRESDIASIQGRINSKQKRINELNDWIDDHPKFWDAAGRAWRWVEIKVLEGEKSALKVTKSGYEGALSVARDGLKKAQTAAEDLETKIDSLLKVPTSLAELAAQGNPVMSSWLDGWRDKKLNIIIQDTVDLNFVDHVRALNTQN
jgi:hypothetical protein